jgi:ATP-dependent protease HslVU (ClpYQ) ATPase subunit
MATAKKAKKVSRASLMRQYYNGNPDATPVEVAKKFKTTYQIAYMAKRSMDKNKLELANKIGTGRKLQGVGKWKLVTLSTSNESVLDTINPECVKPEEPKADPVNHPEHYKVGGIETIDFIEAKALSYHLGNAVKYITRADHKGNRLQDLQKAKWYIDRAIEKAGA